jgi:hypothetical protein
LLDWEASIADTRIHGTLKRQVGKLFREVERLALLPLPQERFPFFHEAQRKVSRDGHIEVAKAYYSVPPEYLGREVWARWDARLVRVFNSRFQQVAMHVRHEPGRFSTLDDHVSPRKINSLERGVEYLLNKVRYIGPQSHQWAQAMLHARGIEGTRVLQGLLSLTKKHASTVLEKACETALSHGAFRLQTLRKLLQCQADKQQPLRFWTSIRSSVRSTITLPSWLGRSFARQIAPPWAKVLKGMTGQKQAAVRCMKKARQRRCRHRRASRSCFRPVPVIPRQVAPQQSLAPFRRIVPA